MPVAKCLCGDIELKFDNFQVTALCSCRNCQQTSGSAFSVNNVHPKGSMQVVKGQVKTFNDKGESGNPLKRCFCGNCGSPMYSEGHDGTFYVKAGNVDEGFENAPVMSVFCRNRPEWAAPKNAGNELPNGSS